MIYIQLDCKCIQTMVSLIEACARLALEVFICTLFNRITTCKYHSKKGDQTHFILACPLQSFSSDYFDPIGYLTSLNSILLLLLLLQLS